MKQSEELKHDVSKPHMEIVFTEEEHFQKIGRISASSHEKPLQKYQTRDRMD